MGSNSNTILSVLILIAGLLVGLLLCGNYAEIPGIILICITVIVAFLNQKKNFFKL